jgi:acyl carrier protein
MSDTNIDVQSARAFVAGVLELPMEMVPPDGNVDTIPAWDSLGHVRLLLEIEAETGRPLDTNIIATLRSVEDVARVLASRATI